jgi:hypothetical protein
MLFEAPDHPGEYVLNKYLRLRAFVVSLLVAAAPAHAHRVAWKGGRNRQPIAARRAFDDGAPFAIFSYRC